MTGDDLASKRWGRISAIFGAAIELPPSERALVVAQQTASEPDLAPEVIRLLRLSTEAGDFLEAPAYHVIPSESSPLLAVGELIADRFRIVRFLGRGGMGEVYEAHDGALREAVALKVMRVGIADAQVMGERFRQEAQLARRVSHPGVCRVHDVAFHRRSDGEELVALTMELLQGETLAMRLRRGPMDAAEAIAVAARVAEALDAAHAQRVLHRDIKPGNVFIEAPGSADPRVVLTDFGLAHGLDTRAPTQTPEPARGVFGTPEYMSPEQLTGAAPSAGADLYAFSVMLYEMVAGRRPFAYLPTDPGADGVPAAPPPVAQFVTGVDTRWDEVFARALHTDPSKRFTTASAIVGALNDEDRTALAPIPAGRKRRVVGVSAGLIVLSLFVAFLRIPERDPKLAAASDLLLVNTVNVSGDGTLDGFGEVIRSQLAQSPHFNLVSPGRVSAALQLMRRSPTTALTPDVAREIAFRENAPLVVHSELRRHQTGYALELKLEEVGSRPTFARSSWTSLFSASDRDGLFEAAHQGTLWIRRMVGESVETLKDQDRLPAETTTSSWEALRLLARANQSQAGGRTNEALLLLNDAVRLDPGFAIAQMRRADLLIGTGRDLEGYAAWRDAVRASERHQLTNREHLRIRAQYAEDAGEWSEAETAYRTYVVHYPNDPEAAFLLGSVLRNRGRTKEAMTWYTRATELRPAWIIPMVHLATAHLETRQSDDANRLLERLRGRGEADWANWLEALAAFVSGDPDGALARLEPLRRSGDMFWRSRAFTLRAGWLLERGNAAAAEAELRAGIEFDSMQGFREREADKWLHLAQMEFRRNALEAGRSATSRAVAMGPSTQRVMYAGTLLARAGQLIDAEALLKEFDNQPQVARVTAARDRLLGEIALASGRFAEAVQILGGASKKESPYPSRLYLARALTLAGEPVAALGVLEDEIDQSARLYRSPDPPLVGVWADTVSLYRSLGGRLAGVDAPREKTASH